MEKILYLLVGFVMGLFLMAVIQWLENEWYVLEDFEERIKKWMRKK